MDKERLKKVRFTAITFSILATLFSQAGIWTSRNESWEKFLWSAFAFSSIAVVNWIVWSSFNQDNMSR